MIRSIAPRYDLFKLVVMLILLALLILISIRSCSPFQVPVAVTEIAGINLVVTASPSVIAATPVSTTSVAVATPTIGTTMTVLPEISPTPDSLATPINEPQTAATETQAPRTNCAMILPSQLNIGNTARVLRNLNLRSTPEITGRLLQTNPTGTQVVIIDGPVCTPQGGFAYLWWKIRLGTGAEGWSAETPLNDRIYFLEPVP